MAKTTMGEFLAILRKSKGMTQQDAADRLGVSNKTVSSWETGASSPDISLLPVIAELYGVTCDELLRGERISPAEPPQATEQKREKALAHLLARYKNNVSVAAMISYGLAVLAALLTLILAFAAFQSRLGFFIGLILLAASLFVTLLACRRAVFLISQNDFEAEATERFFLYLFRIRGRVCLVCAAAFGFIFPHVFIPAYMGLSIGSAFLFGSIGAAAAFLIAGFIYLLIKSKSERFPENERKYLRFKLINSSVIFGCAALISAAAIAAVCIYNSVFLHADGIVSLGLSYKYNSLEDLETAAESCELFTKYEYTLLREEPLPAEGEGRAESVYLFPAEGNDHLDEGDFYGYNYRTTAEGIELTLFRYRLNVAGAEGETAEFLAAFINLQNKELSVRREDWRYLLTANEPAEPNPYPDLYPWDVVGALVISAGAGAAAIVIYCKRRKKYLAEHPRDAKR